MVHGFNPRGLGLTNENRAFDPRDKYPPIRFTYFTHVRDDITAGNLLTDPATTTTLAAYILQGTGLSWESL